MNFFAKVCGKVPRSTSLTIFKLLVLHSKLKRGGGDRRGSAPELAELVVAGGAVVPNVHLDARWGEADALARGAARVLVVETRGTEPALLVGQHVVALGEVEPVEPHLYADVVVPSHEGHPRVRDVRHGVPLVHHSVGPVLESQEFVVKVGPAQVSHPRGAESVNPVHREAVDLEVSGRQGRDRAAQRVPRYDEVGVRVTLQQSLGRIVGLPPQLLPGVHEPVLEPNGDVELVRGGGPSPLHGGLVHGEHEVVDPVPEGVALRTLEAEDDRVVPRVIKCEEQHGGLLYVPQQGNRCVICHNLGHVGVHYDLPPRVPRLDVLRIAVGRRGKVVDVQRLEVLEGEVALVAAVVEFDAEERRVRGPQSRVRHLSYPPRRLPHRRAGRGQRQKAEPQG
mmetsp:Transcript_4725/g.16948  ORF Transcript_4725/g.16948 Transcript_4725/m.16948 type:complete len:394 (+) Transcript_4725:12-1193(+)